MPDRRTVLAAASRAEPDREQHANAARRFFELLSTKDIDTWADLWHDDGRIIVFYPADGFPNTIDGKATIVPAFRDMFTNYETCSSAAPATRTTTSRSSASATA